VEAESLGIKAKKGLWERVKDWGRDNKRTTLQADN